jgi:hypothetical protein
MKNKAPPKKKVLAELDENTKELGEDDSDDEPVAQSLPRGGKKEKTVDEKFQKVCGNLV